ncbi:MAG: hypothetical protein R2795_02820 [Saprospiraceae bacterium]
MGVIEKYLSLMTNCGVIFVGYEENFEDFEIAISGGLFLPEEDNEVFCLVKRGDGEVYNRFSPLEYDFTHGGFLETIQVNENPFIVPQSVASSAMVDNLIVNLTVSNGCKTISKPVYICGGSLAALFFVESVDLPCEGFADGRISIQVLSDHIDGNNDIP